MQNDMQLTLKELGQRSNVKFLHQIYIILRNISGGSSRILVRKYTREYFSCEREYTRDRFAMSTYRQHVHTNCMVADKFVTLKAVY